MKNITFIDNPNLLDKQEKKKLDQMRVTSFFTANVTKTWATTEDTAVQGLQNDKEQGWHPPSSNCFKMNLDGVVFSNQKATGVGVTIWDDMGRLEVAIWP